MGRRRDRRFHAEVGEQRQPAADWKDESAYAPLLLADRSIFSWEWLRRDPAYRLAARASREGDFDRDPFPGPELWGLHAFEDPGLAAPEARPMWRADVHDLVLGAVAAKTAAPADRLDLAGFGRLATVFDDAGGEHLLLSDGLRCIRVDIRAGTIRDGPALLHYRIVGLDSAQGPSLTLRRLLALCSSGRFSAGLHPPEARARRFIMLLRAHDALAAGASQREIAEVLLSAEAQGRRWRVTAPSLRSRAQRLARGAGAMANGGYRRLLGQTDNAPG